MPVMRQNNCKSPVLFLLSCHCDSLEQQPFRDCQLAATIYVSNKRITVYRCGLNNLRTVYVYFTSVICFVRLSLTLIYKHGVLEVLLNHLKLTQFCPDHVERTT